MKCPNARESVLRFYVTFNPSKPKQPASRIDLLKPKIRVQIRDFFLIIDNYSHLYYT